MPTIPFVIEKDARSERTYDLYSRLLEDRIIFLSGEINFAVANSIVAQLLYLETKDPEKDIYFYINSQGGSVSDGLAIYDTMNYVQCDVNTICVGLAASMAAVLLAAGAKGKRMALPNSEVMIHQPMGGVQGQAADVEIVAKHILKIKDKINHILAKHTGQKVEKIKVDSDRDYYMSSEEALKYGIIDKIIESRKAFK
ncbi:MAG: ATP-dependent Clp endopeptidase proteolytic subunit ClpP [Bacillota bacterium]|nr:ATP-dependent Clp endopeptidase proteolytic subunit ClpP [Bacillota bacterium]HHU43155.1 ATP-dependent Clp endopeptidase proteolytic subunit ClpP [Clostridiales bacterium]